MFSDVQKLDGLNFKIKNKMSAPRTNILFLVFHFFKLRTSRFLRLNTFTNTSNQRIWTDIKVELVWEKKLLAGGFFLPFSSGWWIFAQLLETFKYVRTMVYSRN